MTNLIGVSGKLQTGKDTITKIIQWLTFNQEHNTNIPFEKMDNYYKASNWKNVKFADKLKDCVCLILGCTREQLEDPEFKNNLLEKEWGKYKIGYITYINSSEVTVVEKEYYIYEEFINAIKKAKEDKQKYNIEIEILTPRKLLQLLGTECGRKIIHPNIWCIATFNDYKGDVEEWKDIEGYENSYQVSSFGNVRSLDRTVIYGDKKGQYHTIQGKLLKPTLSDGYETVGLSGKTFTVHRLVAKAFIPNFSEDLVINHIDGNKSNNFYKNLECITQSENIKKSIKTTNGNIGVHQKDSKLNDEMVIEIRKHLLEKKLNQREIADLYNVSPSTISEIKTGRKWKHVGDETVITPSPIVPTKYPNWVISDVRFPNEAEAIKDRGGILIRVERNTGNTEIHDSEIALDDYKDWNYVIDNNGTIEELIEKVKEILIKEKILWME